MQLCDGPCSSRHGKILRSNPDENGLIFGDHATQIGESGGGVFSTFSGGLMGMAVGTNTANCAIVPSSVLHTFAGMDVKEHEKKAGTSA